MRALHENYEAKGLTVLGFPCNQFGAQEPGTEAEILEFVTSKFGATFPLFAKIDVNGPNAAPLYAWLTEQAPREDGASEIAWNFTKFLVGPDGGVIRRYEPPVTPEQIGTDLEGLLNP